MTASLAGLSGDDLVAHTTCFVANFAQAVAHEPLDRVDRVVRVHDGLALRGDADQLFAVLLKSDHTWDRSVALCRCNNGGFAPFHHCDHRVGRP